MERAPLADIELHFVQSEITLEAFRAWEPQGLVACDVETSGLQPYGAKPDTLRLVQFGDENTGWAIPAEHTTLIQEGLSRFDGRMVGHNSIFDESFLKEAGFSFRSGFDCTYRAHHLLRPLGYHGLKAAAAEAYGREVRGGEKWLDTVKRKNGWDWATVPVDHPAYWGYAALDTVLTCRLGNDLLPEVRAKFPTQYDRERRVATLMAGMARTGLRIDTEYAEGLLGKWGTETVALRKRLEELSIENPGSTAQIAAALENDGWEPDVLTETGKPSVNREVLEGLDNEIAGLVLRWRRLTKWGKAYVEPMLECGGRLHPNISSLRAATGRMSVSDPPLQQLPRGPEVRNCILADEGTEMWAVDYTGQEARLTAAFANDPQFTRAVTSGQDIHGQIATKLFGPGHTREQRGWSKNAYYAYCYGAQSSRLASTAHAPVGAAEKAIGAAFPGITAFQKGVAAKARERLEEDGLAWARTAGGRVVAVPKSRIYALTNYLMQGSGSDLMKAALERIDDAGLGHTGRLVVHDEVLVCLPPGPEGAEQAETIRKCMESTFRGIEFVAHSNGPGNSWGDVA